MENYWLPVCTPTEHNCSLRIGGKRGEVTLEVAAGAGHGPSWGCVHLLSQPRKSCGFTAGLLKSKGNWELPTSHCTSPVIPPQGCCALYPVPQTAFLNFQDLSLRSLLSILLSMTPAHFNISLIPSSSEHSPCISKRNPSMLCIKKTKESYSKSLWMTVWERMGNATLILSPHSFSADEHCIGDIPACGKYYCNGLHTAQNKEHTFIFKFGTTREEYSGQWTKTVHDP